MLFSDIPFTKFQKLLLDLGFVERVLDGKSSAALTALGN